MANTDTSIEQGIAAAKSGSLADMQAWLDAGADPDRHDKDGWTPLLWASARGHAEKVNLLLDRGADIRLPHGKSAALCVHMAGHSGSVAASEAILNRAPDLINAVWDLNGHTILLQAVFYGHFDLARCVCERGADTSITTARGLGPLELATQFQNTKMIDILKPYDTPAEDKAAYYKAYLERIAPVVPEAEKGAQALADEMARVISRGLADAAKDPAAVDAALARMKELIEDKGADVNRLGGALQQPPLIVAVTGNNGFPPNEDMARLRLEAARMLLEHGADPTKHEEHPMGAQTVIRAAVFNHLDILKMCAEYITPRQLADAINEYPVVNGLTALHDTVLRATMAAAEQFPGYLEQTRFFIQNGGRSDIEDFAGVTQRNIAENCPDTDKRTRLLAVLDGN